MRWLILIAVLAALSSGCSSDKTTASDPPVTTPPTAASSQANCESIPLPQFNFGGVTYTARQSTDVVSEADLGEVLGTQVGDIPQGLFRCEDVQLKDGQGSLEPSSHVYAIRGLDQSIAIAAEVDTGYLKLYAP